MERSFAGLPKPVPLLAASPSWSTRNLGTTGSDFAGRRVGIQQVLIADDQNAFGQAGDFLIRALDSFDDHRAGRAAENLRLAEAVNVRVIPVEAGRLVLWNAESILEGRVAGLDGSFQDVVLMADGWDCEAVKVEIGGR